ncbi:MAG: hypothetical protein M3Q50_15230, partial [Chloroflexota bacterium]|nr:hypothetical protein [Chloroflexota bacterium]
MARLSKDGRRVLCGRPNCGETLADVVVNAGAGRPILFGASGGSWSGFDGKHEGQPRQVDSLTVFDRAAVPATAASLPDRATVVFRAGWLPDQDGVWSLTKRAQRRRDADQQIALDTSRVSARERKRARQRLATGRSTGFTHRAADNLSGVTQPQHPEHRADLP